MTFIEGEITIARPAETVFDFAADQRNEPRYNLRMVRVGRSSPAARSGRGRCSARGRAGRGRGPTEMRSELTGYHRPGLAGLPHHAWRRRTSPRS